MEQRRDLPIQDTDATSLGVLLGVIAAAFIGLGIVIYFFGEDQSSSMSAANNPPPQSQRSIKARPAPTEPSTVGQGSGSQ